MTDMSMWANIRLRRLRVFPQMCAAYAFMTPDLYFSFRMLWTYILATQCETINNESRTIFYTNPTLAFQARSLVQFWINLLTVRALLASWWPWQHFTHSTHSGSKYPWRLTSHATGCTSTLLLCRARLLTSSLTCLRILSCASITQTNWFSSSCVLVMRLSMLLSM